MFSASFPFFSRVRGGVQRQCFAVSVAAAVCFPLFAHAQGMPLVGGEGVTVYSSDVLGGMEEMPKDVREKFLEEAEQVENFAQTLFLRRFFATQAQQAGVDKNPSVRRQLLDMQERILAEAQLEHVENAALPSNELIDKQIRTIYKGEPQRFTTPAQVHARHILIAGQDDASRAKAEKLLADLRTGADFEQLAREHSADPGSAAKGGDLGFFAKGKMVPAFEKAAFALKKSGDLSPVVQTPFGFHIIRLEGHKPATVKPFDEVKDQLRAETIAKLKNDARKKEVERVRALAQGDAAALEAFIAQQKALLEQTPDKP